jgi:methyl-accepting chemotaxis protein
MSGQAEQLQQTMSFFKLDSAGSRQGASHFQVRKSSASSKAAKSAVSKIAVSHAASAAPAGELDESQFTKF